MPDPEKLLHCLARRQYFEPETGSPLWFFKRNFHSRKIDLSTRKPLSSSGDTRGCSCLQSGGQGASFELLRTWARPSMRSNLKRTLDVLENKRAFVHFDGKVYKITHAGERHVEERRLLDTQT